VDPTATPVPVVLEGRHVRLEPLLMDHLGDLLAGGLDPELWRWSPDPVRDADDLRRWVERALDEARRRAALPFAIVELEGGRAVGSTRYGSLAPEHRRLEIGWTWIARPWQRTAINTETKWLLLRHAFEELGCHRVEFKTDALNARSRAALARIGAREEGTLRRHMVTADGRVRDTVYYAVVAEEWPAVRAGLERKLGWS
jgi:RimJ/RimL family protein N-acetyltransferase